MNEKFDILAKSTFFQKFLEAPIFFNSQISFKKVQCRSSGYHQVKFGINLIGRSSVHSVSSFRGHPRQSPTLWATICFYPHDIFPALMTNPVKFRENRPSGLRDIIVFHIGEKLKK